ncbi:MAG TPA: VWA domain-containing protein, partial [Hyphomonadaceae bacterium]|nr:VWA domain-containing protein [Hyphomonadaceae bacterium]
TTSCNSAGLTPLTNHQGTLISAISTMPTSGGTAGHLGIAWAWYLISPDWAGIWGSDSAPRAYDEPDSTKVAILMTDGEFNTDYMSNGNSFDHAQRFCDAMKAEGIVIYTVAFQAPQQGQNILNYCSSGSEYAFNASNGEQLEEAYQAIATNISDLRISH